ARAISCHQRGRVGASSWLSGAITAGGFRPGSNVVGCRLVPIAFEDDLARGADEDDTGERGRARLQGDREMVRAEPSGEPVGVTLELQTCDLDACGAVVCRALAWKRGPLTPLDEERKRGLECSLLDSGQSPAQEPTLPGRPRANGHGQAESSRNLVELVRADRPTERLRKRRARI